MVRPRFPTTGTWWPCRPRPGSGPSSHLPERRDLSMPYDRRFYGIDFNFDSFNGMPYLRLGGSGLRVARVGLGTWKFGYPERNDGSRIGRDMAFRIMDRALELGATFWDTANRYNESSGNSERVIGEWFREHSGERRNIVLATKMAGAMDGVTPNHCGL